MPTYNNITQHLKLVTPPGTNLHNKYKCAKKEGKKQLEKYPLTNRNRFRTIRHPKLFSWEVVVCGHGVSPAFKIPGYGQRPYSIWFQNSSILGDFELFHFLGSAHSLQNPENCPPKLGWPSKSGSSKVGPLQTGHPSKMTTPPCMHA